MPITTTSISPNNSLTRIQTTQTETGAKIELDTLLQSHGRSFSTVTAKTVMSDDMTGIELWYGDVLVAALELGEDPGVRLLDYTKTDDTPIKQSLEP